MVDQDFIIKVAVLALYVGVLFLIGILASRKIKGMSDYYVGGKNMGFWAVAFSAIDVVGTHIAKFTIVDKASLFNWPFVVVCS